MSDLVSYVKHALYAQDSGNDVWRRRTHAETHASLTAMSIAVQITKSERQNSSYEANSHRAG